MRFKQEILQFALRFPVKAGISVALCASCTIGPAGLSQAQMPTIGSADRLATLRLVAAAGLEAGRYEAGVDLTMAPGSHTYWKIPGEAGVPPVFVFNGSENVSEAKVEYPAPSRISEEGIEAYGYTGQVVFPVMVTPADRSKPAVLHVDLTYAVCNKICVPGHDAATITLRPDGGGTSPDLVTAALARVPATASAADRQDLELTPDPDPKKPQWLVVWKGSVPVEDVFADAPEGYFFATRKLAPNRWTLTASQSVSTPAHDTVALSLVLARKTDSVAVPEKLDVRAPGK